MPIKTDSVESAVMAVRSYVSEVMRSVELGFRYHAEVIAKAEARELHHCAVAFDSWMEFSARMIVLYTDYACQPRLLRFQTLAASTLHDYSSS